jgi:ribosomal protein L29
MRSIASPDGSPISEGIPEGKVALDARDWQELYEGAREVFGPTRAAIFMNAMEQGFRNDLATKPDLSELRAATRADLAEFRAATQADLAEYRAATKADLAGLRSQMSDLRAATGGDLTELRSQMSELRAATRADLSDLRASFEEKLRAQTWTIVGVFVALGGLTVSLAHVA